MASERQISVGGVKIGGGAPVVVQSMTLTKTHDVEATTAQVAALASAGCEIVRVAVPKTVDAEALGSIGGSDKVAQVVRAAQAAEIPMRIGANSGSLPKHLNELAQHDQAEALVE